MKLQKHLLLFSFLTISLLSFSQEKSLYYEDFSSGSTWPTGNNDRRELVVENGKYYFEHKKDDDLWNVTTRDIDFNTSKDFEIETSIQKIEGTKSYAFGLLFGNKDIDNTFHFMIGIDGQYRVSEKNEGAYNQIQAWTKAESINTNYNGYNKLKVKKTGNTLYFYINDVLVTSTDFRPFFANKIGVMVYNQQKIAIDYLSVKEQSGATVTSNGGNIIMKDDFNSNPNNWPESNTENMEAVISNGKYYFEHKRATSGWNSTQKLTIDTSKDFKIETKIQKVSGVDNYGYGLLFGRKDNDNQYIFAITSSGFYGIDNFDNGTNTTVKKWTATPHINKGDNAYNTLKVVKEEGFIKFYVNDRYLSLISYKDLKGTDIGYVVYNKQKIAVEDLEVSYINQTKPFVSNDDLVVTTGDVLLEELFNNNANNWSIGNTNDRDISIANSLYNFEHKHEEGGWSVNIAKTIDTTRDFEISTTIKKVGGVDNYSYGLQWAKEEGSSFRFYISGNGYYKISRMVDNKEEVIKKFTTSSYINKGNGATNKLTIKKIGGTNKYYINDNYITETDFESFYGNRIGYIIYSKQKIAVDNLTIKYLKKSNTTIVTNNTLQVPLSESFSSNLNAWSLKETVDTKTRITGGKLYVKNNNEKSGAFISKKIAIDTNKDFIIETSITRQGSSNASIAFVFGRKNNTNEYDLFLSKDSYLFRRLENDTSNKIIPWTTTSALKTTAYASNIIKIVKSGGLLRFYINGTYINEAPFTPFFGDYLGYSVYEKQEISVDYLNISYPSNNDFNAPPEVVITEPIVERGFKIVKTKKILVRGKATDKDGIYEIKINGVDATIKETGEFSAEVPLKIGDNDLVVKATDLKQASSTKTFSIKRKSPDVNDDVVVVNNNDNNLDVGFGKYYALLIGVSSYGDGAITDLGGLPSKDAQDLANILVEKYNFNKENVIVLNNSPKENEIIKEFSKLKKKVTNKDNLLVFYAGHGIYDEKSQVGHWLPSDADMEYELNLISNSQVVDYLKGIQSKHTLLISDACFSGSIFKTREFKAAPKSVQKKYELTSRKAITSGTLKTVPNKSVFLKYLLKRLEDNSNNYLSARQLFNNIEEPVMNNSPNTPQYGTIYGIGDEGGDFIFIKKQ